MCKNHFGSWFSGQIRLGRKSMGLNGLGRKIILAYLNIIFLICSRVVLYVNISYLLIWLWMAMVKILFGYPKMTWKIGLGLVVLILNLMNFEHDAKDWPHSIVWLQLLFSHFQVWQWLNRVLQGDHRVHEVWCLYLLLLVVRDSNWFPNCVFGPRVFFLGHVFHL